LNAYYAAKTYHDFTKNLFDYFVVPKAGLEPAQCLNTKEGTRP
jgi:hypothetical protein